MGGKNSKKSKAPAETPAAAPSASEPKEEEWNDDRLKKEDIAALVATSGKTEQEIKESFFAFLKDHPSGKINQEEFKELLKQALPKKYVNTMAEHIYRMYDENQDGSIDFKEFMVIFYVMSEGSEEEVLKGIFRAFDTDGNGSLTLDEIKKLVKSIYRLLKKDDPNLESEKFIADSTFAECDKDGDGKVTREEFIASCLDKGAFTTLLTMKIVDIFTAEEAPVAEAAATPAPTDSPAPAAAAAPTSDPTPAPAPEVAQ